MYMPFSSAIDFLRKPSPAHLASRSLYIMFPRPSSWRPGSRFLAHRSCPSVHAKTSLPDFHAQRKDFGVDRPRPGLRSSKLLTSERFINVGRMLDMLNQ